MELPNITREFIQRLKTNGKEAEDFNLEHSSPGSPAKKMGQAGARYWWFYNKVKAGGPWDFKSNWLKPYRETGVRVGEQPYRFDMPGNFHFGYVGIAAGFDAKTLHKLAGAAQKDAGTARPDFWCTYGDDPEDYMFIKLGIKLYQQHGLNIWKAHLQDVLDQYYAFQCPAK